MTEKKLIQKLVEIGRSKMTNKDKAVNVFKILAQYFQDEGDLKTAKAFEDIVEDIVKYVRG